MRTVRRLLYKDIVASVAFVAVAFLSLFYFIAFIDELDRMNRLGAGPGAAALLALLEMPNQLYDLFPIAVLIGSIFSLARLAQSTEFTILRTGGLGPGRALSLLTLLALVFAVLTFLIGDFVAPWSEKQAELMRNQKYHGTDMSQAGAWLKDRQHGAGGEHSFSVNVKAASINGELSGVRIFEFDAQGRLLSRTESTKAKVDRSGLWRLQDVQRAQWSLPDASGTPRIWESHLDDWEWQSGGLTTNVITSALLPAWTMSTLELYRYTAHLSAQEQSAQQYDIQFWRKALYPFACLVMVGLALPFAYLHGRSGGISLKVFGGIMLGISFVLLNNLASHLGLLKQWTPWAVAAAPSLLYLLLSLAAFTWLVRYR